MVPPPYNYSAELPNETTVLEAEYQLKADANYYMAMVNIPMSTILILANILHFCVLTRKELRTNPIFIIMMFQSVCDMVTAILSSILNSHTIMIYGRTDYCYIYDSYTFLSFNMAASSVIGGASFSIPWFIILMAFYRSAAITFPMSTIFDRITKPRTIIFIVLTITIAMSTWIFVSIFGAYSLKTRREDSPCFLIKDIDTTVAEQYAITMDDDGFDFSLVTNDIEIGIKVMEVICFIVSTFWLVTAMRKVEKNRKKLMQSGNSEKSKNSTTKLVLVMNLFAWLCAVDECLFLVGARLTAENDYGNEWLSVFVPIKYLLTFLQSSCHCLVCYGLSTQYRSVAKQIWRSCFKKNMENVVMVESCETKVPTK